MKLSPSLESSTPTPDTHGSDGKGVIGVDFDGTLCFYDHWRGPEHTGAPIKRMVDRVKTWLEAGEVVKIFTARANPNKPDYTISLRAIEAWCKEHIGTVLPITHEKDPLMKEIWDDRVVQVIPNTGERADGKP